jgi:hypothetical protein
MPPRGATAAAQASAAVPMWQDTSMLADLAAPLLALLPPAVAAPLAGGAGAVAVAAILALLLPARRGLLAPFAAGVALLAAVLWLLPPILPSPRQVVERLPLLVALLAVGAGLPALIGAPGWLVRLLPLLAGAWWMAGAPIWGPDV